IRDSRGHVVGVSVVHRDISERKRSERDLRQMHQWLEMAQEAGGVAPWADDPKNGRGRWAKQMYPQPGYGLERKNTALSTFCGRNNAVFVSISRARTSGRSNGPR